MSKFGKDDLGRRMKTYEAANERYLTRRTPVILRIDGCHFHTFTRGFSKPFDEVLIKTMQETTKYLCENIQGCVLGYTQSDEITLVLVDYKKLTSSAWFDNRQNKMESVAASMTTMVFNKLFIENVKLWIENNEKSLDNTELDKAKDQVRITYENAIKLGAYFDCRAFNLPVEEVANNLYWRQLDASRNSIQMLAQSQFSHKELQNKSCNELQDMLMIQKGINWNDLETYKKRGTCVVKNSIITNYSENTQTCLIRDSSKSENEWIIDENIPIFKNIDRDYIEMLVRYNL